MEFVPIKRAADIHGVSVSVLKNWYLYTNPKPFTLKKIGRRLMVNLEEVQRAVDALPEYVPNPRYVNE